jgi:AcrR family transcriptional regulator
LSTKPETLDRILASARKVFAATGLKQATMTSIADEAGVTKQLLYHYYQSKNDLFAAVLNAQAEAVLSALNHHVFRNGDPELALRRFLGFAFDQYQNDPTLPALAKEAISFHKEQGQRGELFAELAPNLTAHMAALIERGIASGAFAPSTDPKLFPAMAILATLGNFYNNYMLSGLLGFDTQSQDGMEQWRAYAIEFLLTAIRNRSPQS